eukprot:m.100413 g.100413  ORF g.100413 m.100413 type:complete len:85 (+) comp8754_c0_seq1:65-319(+)
MHCSPSHIFDLLLIQDWLLHPPANAFFAARHVQDALLDEDAVARAETGYRCTQLPGDALFVPYLWGHAVVNTRTSLAIALELYT